MELLREAAESDHASVWWVNALFFFGFLAALILSKVCAEEV